MGRKRRNNFPHSSSLFLISNTKKVLWGLETWLSRQRACCKRVRTGVRTQGSYEGYVVWQPVCSPEAKQAETGRPGVKLGAWTSRVRELWGSARHRSSVSTVDAIREDIQSYPYLPHKHKHVCAHMWAATHANTYANTHAYCMHMPKGSEALQK